MEGVASALNAVMSVNVSPNQAINTAINAFGSSMKTALAWNEQMLKKEQIEQQFLDSLIKQQTQLAENMAQLDLSYYNIAQQNARQQAGFAHSEKMAYLQHNLSLSRINASKQSALERLKVQYGYKEKLASIKNSSKISGKNENKTYTEHMLDAI